jgi:uncharacterized membrane protein YfcA
MLWLSVVFGGIVGVSLGLTGGGGAIFAVPMLVYGLGRPAREAVVVSLVAVGVTSLIGFLQKWRRGEAELPTGGLFALAGMVGAPCGTWLARQIPESMLMLLFSVLMLSIAGVMWGRARRASSSTQVCIPLDPATASDSYRSDGPGCQRDASGNLILTSRCARLLLLAGVFAGILSGMFGVGGGFLIVPALVLFSRMSMLRAVGTSLMVIAIVSFSAVFSQVSAGQQFPWLLTLTFVAGGLMGLWGGQLVGQRLSAALLQKLFAVAILGVGLLVLARNVMSG